MLRIMYLYNTLLWASSAFLGLWEISFVYIHSVCGLCQYQFACNGLHRLNIASTTLGSGITITEVLQFFLQHRRVSIKDKAVGS
jgi:hypothetical protein